MEWNESTKEPNSEAEKKRKLTTELGILGNVIPVVYTKVISRKEQSITQLNVSNSFYVLDQHSNYMFRPLEAIFRLHK